MGNWECWFVLLLVVCWLILFAFLFWDWADRFESLWDLRNRREVDFWSCLCGLEQGCKWHRSWPTDTLTTIHNHNDSAQHSTGTDRQTDRQFKNRADQFITDNRQQTTDNGTNHCCHLSSHNGMPAPNWNRPGPPAYSLHPRALKIFRQKYNYQKSAQFLVQFLISKY